MGRSRIAPRVLGLLPLGLALGASLVSAQTKLLRYPDIHDQQVAFCYAGDLWLAPASGGSATRLTAHPGLELFPKFSPDGRWIAFTGQYDGDEQVYAIPTAGGVPQQLTFYPARGPLPPRWGYDNQIYGWTVDGKAVLFRSMRDGWSLTDTRLYIVALDGGLPEPLPMPVSGAGDFSPDGKRIVYSPLIRDFRTWKRYEGGWAQDLFIFDLASHEALQITDHPRSDRDPMWIDETIYFSSDRTGTLNLYDYDTRTRETRQRTHSDLWDVRWPSADGRGQIVYEMNGELRIFDARRGQERSIAISVPNDGVAMRPARISAEEQIEDFELSPKGERAVFVARGDVFSAPIEKGPTRNLTHSSGAHDKWARWSPDGTRIAFVSDRDGEDEIYVVAQDGTAAPEQLTDGGAAMRYAAEWASDGKRLAFGDKDGKLWVLELASRKLMQVADEPQGQVQDYVWSPGGGQLAFSLSDPDDYRSLYIWSVEDGQTRRITGPEFNESEPAWDPDGNYLYYLSDREFAPLIANVEWNYATDRTESIFALALRKDVAHPFPPESDEVTAPGEEDKKEGGTAKGKKKKDEEEKEAKDGKKKDKGNDKEEKEDKPAGYIKIDFDGLAQRVARVPVPADNYEGLDAPEGYLLYVRSGGFYYGRDSYREPELHVFSIEDREDKLLAEKIRGYALSRDGKKALVRHEDGFKLYEVDADGDDSPKAVSTKGLMVDRVPAEEWAQVFDEVWRRFRDFFYVGNMHGYDWPALGARYRPLLQHVAHRSDLNYVIGEMIGELNVGHAYIAGGDFEIPPRPQVALPGARFALDRASGRYRIARIFRGQNEEERYRAPLTEIGVDVREGDYVLAIDGVELRGGDNPYRLLLNKADRPVQLTVNRQPSFEGARKVTFRPITSETSLIYLDWVEGNRRKVDQLTGGKAGYLHLPDMGGDGIREFVKWFYGQVRKEGLVVDVRNNGGGNVSQMVIERLRRVLLGTRFSRTSDLPGTYPSVVHHGHKVCILDENSASDGDIFPYMFRQAGLGPLIGKRSWGGVVGITDRGPLIDGGVVFVPEFGTNAPDGSWIIEGHGVDPDIKVENDPQSVLAGRDPQLERAVEELLRMMRDEPRHLPERPAPPVKIK